MAATDISNKIAKLTFNTARLENGHNGRAVNVFL